MHADVTCWLRLQVKRVVDLSREALEQGKCVVIGLQSTGEAAQNAFQDDLGEDLSTVKVGVLAVVVVKGGGEVAVTILLFSIYPPIHPSSIYPSTIYLHLHACLSVCSLTTLLLDLSKSAVLFSA